MTDVLHDTRVRDRLLTCIVLYVNCLVCPHIVTYIRPLQMRLYSFPSETPVNYKRM